LPPFHSSGSTAKAAFNLAFAKEAKKKKRRKEEKKRKKSPFARLTQKTLALS
jgi:hypothetical protein